MGKLTKASFAAAKRRLGIKKVTKKNIGRIAKAARRGTGKRSSPKKKGKTSRKSSSKKGGRSMARGKSLYQGMKKLAQASALIAPLAATALGPGNRATKVQWISRRYFGYDTKTAQWVPWDMVQGWGPFVGLTIGLKVVSKIRAIIGSI